MTKPPLERAARALCSLDGHPEDAKMDGKPLWQDYLPEARAVIEAIRETGRDSVAKACEDDRIIAWGDYGEFWEAMIDVLLAEGE